MKKGRLAIAIIFSVLTIVMMVIGIVTRVYDKDSFDFSKQKIIRETIALGNFSKLEVNSSTVDIIIERGSSYSLGYNVPEKLLPIISQKADCLTIEQPSFKTTLIRFSKPERSYYKITIPKDVDIFLNLASADAHLKGFSSKKIELNIASGDLDIEDCRIENLVLSITSGEVEIDNCSFLNVVFNSTSGDAEFDDCIVDNFKYKVVSGNIKMSLYARESDYDYDMSCLSGRIEIDNIKRGKNHIVRFKKEKIICGQATSGNVTIEFKD